MDGKQMNLASLSKPIKVGPQKNDIISRVSHWLTSNEKINVFFKQKDNGDQDHSSTESNSQPTPPPQSPAEIDEEFIDTEMSKTHSGVTNSKMAEKFFSAATTQDKKEKSSWLSPGTTTFVEQEFLRSKSIGWLIAGAASLLLLVILVFASFGLINLIRDQFFGKQLSEVEIAFNQAQDLYNQNSFEPAKTKVDEILSTSPNYQPAQDLLVKINQKRGEKILENFTFNKELDQTLTPEQIYQDPDSHFQIMLPTDWEKIESTADLKLVSGDSSLTVKKYPKINYLKKAETQFLQNLEPNTTVLITKSDQTIKNSQAEVIALEKDNTYQVSVLLQKYYYAYELTAVLPKKELANQQTIINQFVQSFAVLPQFDLSSYDQLTTFESDNFVFHGWSTLTPEDQTYLKEQFQASLQNINQTLLINWKDKINVYLYPSWDQLYTYTLACNSFSDLANKEMHILYVSPDNHQSFGYETTKIIFQNTFGTVQERFILEGIAVMLDQTNRDYLDLLRQNHFIPLSDLMSVNWELLEGNIKYFEVGVLSRYLIDQYGIDLYINLAKEKEFPEGFKAVYGKDLPELETEIKTNLNLQP